MGTQKLVVKMAKPFTRKPIKPRQAHKIATRYQRRAKHQSLDKLYG